jgi:hypothetical protein
MIVWHFSPSFPNSSFPNSVWERGLAKLRFAIWLPWETEFANLERKCLPARPVSAKTASSISDPFPMQVQTSGGKQLKSPHLVV